ncbi:hypothetical protein FACS1894187_05010 [Synergistales bacterium]|nr:hypothetical protein FACS1894187_05010 [Synergistales bacterium]
MTPDEATGTGQEQGQGQTSAGNKTADVSLLAGAGRGKSNSQGDNADGQGKDVQNKDGRPGIEDGRPGAVAPTNEVIKAEDFTIPEGKVFDEELGKSYLDIVNDSALSRKDLARKLVDLYSSLQDKEIKAQEEELEKYQLELAGKWEQAAKADKEYGAQNWEKSGAVIEAGRDKVASPELVAWIEENKLGNHPEILRMFYRAGKLIGEDRAAGTVGAAKVDMAEAIFGASLAGLKR